MNNTGKNIGGKGSTNEPSMFDQFFGQHFKSLVVGILILVLIIAFTIICSVKQKLDSEIITLFSSAIMGLIGYFAGSESSKK